MSRAGFRSVALAVAWRNVHNFFTNPALIVPALIFPLFFFTAFAGGLSNVANVPGFDFPDGYTAFQFVFVLLQASAFAGVFTGFAVARDFESGFARRMLLAAPRRGAIVAGYVLAGVTRVVFTYVVITVVALLVGMKVGGNGVDLFGLYGLAVLVNVAATLWSVGVAMRLRTMQAGPAMQMPVFLVLFVAPVWVPLGLLGGWVHAVAQVNPTTVLLEAGRGLISGGPVKVGLAFALVTGLAAVFALWARGGLRSAESAA
jgi:ABC-type multidrug transport system permease subunit